MRFGTLIARIRERAAAHLPLLLIPVFASLAIWRPPILEDYVENLLVDWRFKARNWIAPPAAPGDVVVVAVDEKSLARHGRWPWTRTRIADLIEKVAAGSPRAIGVDLFFAEPESAAADARLAAVLDKVREYTVSALAFDVRRGADFDGEVPDVLFDQAYARIEKAGLLRPVKAFRALLPPEPIASASTFGHVYFLPDRNGKLRWEFLYLRYGQEYFPSLALQAARIARGLPAAKVAILGGRGVDLGGTAVPADDNGRLYINYYGPERTFPYFSAADLLSGALSARTLKDKVVFIGATAVAT